MVRRLCKYKYVYWMVDFKSAMWESLEKGAIQRNTGKSKIYSIYKDKR